MAAPAFPLLGSPVSIGPMRVRNRLALLPHGLFYAHREELVPTRRHLEYYEARARGGVGLVCVESSVVSRDGQQGAPLVLSSDPACVEGYRAIADAVHDAGAKICGQLTHYGNQATTAVTRQPMIAPSVLPDLAMRELCRPMDRFDMARVRDDFVRGAANLVAAGFDAVELKAGHDGLLRQFLSPLTNERTDEYGDSVANRMRYPLEVATAVREATGADVALGIRLVVDEHLPGGYDVGDAEAFARAFEDSGVVDYLSADAGIFASVHMVVAPMSVPEGYEESSIERTAGATSLPVIAFGRIRRPEHAERILAEGKATLVGMARELIADPAVAAKALAGHPERIRPCTACNQLCVGNATKLLPVSCTVNPSAGFGEHRVRSEGQARSVLVIGGGVAGMEAARVAAEDGHRTVLVEATQALGGQLALAARTGGRDGWRPYLDWLESELERLGVAVRLGEAATARTVNAAGAELVVVATGSAPTPAPLGADVPTLDAFLEGDTAPERIALVDLGAAGAPLWTASLEASLRGAGEVAVVTPTPVVGGDLDGATFLDLYGELSRRRVRFVTDHIATAFADGRLSAVNVYSGAEWELEVDVVVASTPRRSTHSPAELVDGGACHSVVTVGDAVAPRDATAAIREGQAALSTFPTRAAMVAPAA